MEIIGIICEYNPFHNGHLYMINKIKEMYPDSIIISVVSGYFTQRGDSSLINKWDKTEIAIKNGIDLVVELPTIYSTQSADNFSYGAVKLLNELNVNKIVFGSETNDIELFKDLASKQLNKDYEDKIKTYLDKGYNYPTAMNKALGFTIDKPNDILALSYVREIIKHNYNIEPISIKRTNDYHDKNLNNEITSASSIRENIKTKNIDKYIPDNSINYYDNLSFTEDYYRLLKYKIISEINDLNKYLDVDEGIDNKIRKEIFNSKTLDELINNVKSKRYTYSKLKRMFVHILLGITKEENNNKEIKYIRILGFNKNGQKYLNKIKKEVRLPIYTKFNKDLECELKVAGVYSSIFDNKTESDFIKKEITGLIRL